MAETRSQRRWRGKYRLVKSQLNVMARKTTRDALAQFARLFALKGKGEAVAFACFVTRALLQRAEYNTDVAQMVEDFAAGYRRDRDIHAA